MRGMAIFPKGLVETMMGAKADTEVIKARRKATVFMVLARGTCVGDEKYASKGENVSTREPR